MFLQRMKTGRRFKRHKRFHKKFKRVFTGLPKNLFTNNNLATYDVSTTDIIDSGSTVNLLFVPQRTNNSFQDRHGDRTVIRSFRLLYTIKPGTLQLTNQWVRITVFWDNQPNNAFPSAPLPFAAFTVTSLPDPQFTQRFRILFDRQVLISPTNFESAAMITGDLFKKNLALTSVFTANAGGIGDIQSGALNMLVIGDTANGANANLVMTFSSRCKFDP